MGFHLEVNKSIRVLTELFRMIWMTIMSSSTTPLTVNRVKTHIECPISQVRKDVVKVPAF